MRLAILSDIHANLEALRATLSDVAAARADRILCLGDIVGYHADPEACIALLRDVGATCIAGNHDRAVAGMRTTSGFSDTAARGVAWTRARLDHAARDWLAGLPLQQNLEGHVIAVHGALLPEGGCDMTRLDDSAPRRKSFAALARHASGARICAFGHTHRVAIHAWRDGAEDTRHDDLATLHADALHLINPGTVGQSRGDDPRATWMLLDAPRGGLEVRRVAYDMEPTLAKARAAGLLAPPSKPSRLRAAFRRFRASMKA